MNLYWGNAHLISKSGIVAESVYVLQGRRAEQTLLSDRTLGEKNNWLVVQEEKARPF